jgi:hypothetical protein
MIQPNFSNYSGSQAIISSDRVINHSKEDGIYLFGKATVGISSPGTINLDSDEAIIVDSDRVELGHNASEQVVLGNKLVETLNNLLTGLMYLSTVMSTMSGTTQAETAVSITLLADAGAEFTGTVNKAIADLSGVLSKITYTA